MNHGLSSQTLAQVAKVLGAFPQLHRAILFGSRAKGTHRPGSDIDLALVGPELSWRVIGQIYEALDDTLLPYRFSLIHLNAMTDPDVAAHIARVGIVVFEHAQTRCPLAS